MEFVRVAKSSKKFKLNNSNLRLSDHHVLAKYLETKNYKSIVITNCKLDAIYLHYLFVSLLPMRSLREIKLSKTNLSDKALPLIKEFLQQQPFVELIEWYETYRGFREQCERFNFGDTPCNFKLATLSLWRSYYYYFREPSNINLKGLSKEDSKSYYPREFYKRITHFIPYENDNFKYRPEIVTIELAIKKSTERAAF